MASAKPPIPIVMAEHEKAAHHLCTRCGLTHADGELPCQAYFLERQLIPAHPVTALPSEGTECGICLEDISIAPSASDSEYLAFSKEVVFLLPCQHFFHQSCILAWHTSVRPERDTCPICRRVLFVADPLTPAQLDQLHEDDQDDQDLSLVEQETGHNTALVEDQPVWVFMNGEYMSMDIIASLAVKREYDSLDAGGRFDWHEVCMRIHAATLTINGSLRPVFRPHKDTFVLCVHAASAVVAMGNNGVTLEAADKSAFMSWFCDLLNIMGPQLTEELCQEMDKDGLFVTPLQPMVVAPWNYQDQPHMNTLAIQDIMDCVMKKFEGRGLRARLRGLARRFWPSRWS